MAGERGDRLHGRERTIAVVREFVARPERSGLPRSRDVPIVLFTGGRGSGKTALLSELASRLDQYVPYARVDCEHTSATSARELLSALTFELNRQRGGYGRLAFPRFVAGQVVIAQKLNTSDPERARQQAERALTEHGKSDTLRKFLHGAAPQPGSLVSSHNTAHVTGTGNVVQAQYVEGDINIYGDRNVSGAVSKPGGRYRPELVLNGLFRPWRRLTLGEGRRWYAHQGLGLRGDPGSTLVKLNRLANSNQEDDRREADALLWAAFLADLRDGFTGWKAASRSLNCVVLLDNVDSSLGRSFQDGLIEARSLHAAHVENEPDPLTVVATSRSSVAPPASVEEASYAHYLKRRSGGRGSGVYSVMLPDLTQDEVGTMLSERRQHSSSNRRVAAVVHTFTGGHAGSTRLVIDALQDDENPADLRVVLDSTPATAAKSDSSTVEDRLLRQLLPDVTSAVFDDLVTCSAARDLGHALRLSAHSDLLTSLRRQRSDELFAPDLWAPVKPDGPAVLRPVLRRVLLRRLAGRPSTHRADWAAVHGWLRDDCEADQVGRLHHLLALGEVEQVTRRMADSLRAERIEDWLDMLSEITAAPNKVNQGDEPIEDVSALTGWAEPQDVPIAPLARLITALWIAGDPLGATRRKSLFQQIAWDFAEVAPHSGRGHAALREEAAKYQRRAEL